MNKRLSKKLSIVLIFTMILSSIFNFNVLDVVADEVDSLKTITETFDNFAETSSSYKDGFFDGVENITWNYKKARGAGATLDGKGLMFGKSDSELYSDTITGGINSLSVQLKKAFTSKNDRKIEVYINDKLIGNSEAFNDEDVHTYTINNIEIKGDIVIKLKNASNGGKQLIIDNLTWSGYAGDKEPEVKVAPITSDPKPGTVKKGTEITLSTTTTSSAIYFTVDGSDPTKDSKLYDENDKPVINDTTTIKAIGMKKKLENSDVATFQYNILKLVDIVNIRDKNGSDAIIEGIVTAKLGVDIYIQDNTAGIVVSTYKLDGADNINVELGDKIHVEGKIQIYKEMSQIKPYTAQTVSVIKKGVGVPEPMVITPDENTDDVEGRLVKLQNVKVVSKDSYGNYTVQDADNASKTTLVKPSDSAWLEEGQVYESIVGVSKYNFGQKILTRTIDDIVLDSSKAIKVTASPNGGIVESGQVVKLSTRTTGSAIYFTTDKSEPTIASELYNDSVGVVIDKDTTLKAIAVKNGLNNSDVVTFEYKIGQLTRIRDIQGAGHSSTLVGKDVNNIRGVVTAFVKDSYDKGFYMQDTNPDNDIKTSEGIYVDMKKNNVGTYVSVGDMVSVNGTVSEVLNGYEGGLKVTELTASSVTKMSSGNKLPEPIVIGEGGRKPSTTIIDNDGFSKFDPEEDAIDFYESIEGMLVKINDPLVVGMDERYGEITVLADNGQASGSKKTIHNGITATKENFNPESITIDDVIVPISGRDKKFIDKNFRIKVGDKFKSSITGVMSYGFGKFKVLNKQKLPEISDGGLTREITKIVPAEDKLTIASYNIENFSAVTDEEKVKKIANSIIANLKKPDIIGLVEVQDEDGSKGDKNITDAEKTYKVLIEAIKSHGGPEYSFTDIQPVGILNPNYGKKGEPKYKSKDGGIPGGNIRVGYLYNPDRVTLIDKPKGGSEESVDYNENGLTLNPGRIEPTSEWFKDCRKSLAAEFEFNGEKVIIIANHFGSKRGDASLFGDVQPPIFKSEVKRHKQAQVVNDFIDKILSVNPNANIVAFGDFNDFEFSDTLAIFKGKGSENVLYNMIDELPKNERFTYVHGGNSQVLDNVLVNHKLMNSTDVDIVNINSEFIEAYGRASDHDPVLVQISILDKDQALVQATTKAIAAINALPTVEKITLADKTAVESARGLVTAAINLGAVEADITNLSKLVALEKKIVELESGAKLKAIQDAIAAINTIPSEDKLTLEDKAVVENARALVNAAIKLGALESEITNIPVLKKAETKIAALDPNGPYKWNNKIPEKKPAKGKDNGKLVLFDNSHMNTAGNADWVLDGGFSDFADALAAEGYTVREYRGIDKNGDGAIRFYDDRNLAADKEGTAEDINEAIIIYEAIKDADVFVTAESNRPLRKSEQAALKKFVDEGKGIYFIGDHYNADRNINTWDATEVYNGYNRSDLDKFNIGGIYGDWRNSKDASKGWLSENFGLRFRFNAIDWKSGVSGLKTDIDTENILNGVQPVLMAAGGTISITDNNIAKGLIYFGASDKPVKWGHAIDEGIYFGGEKEGAFVAISKPSKGKAAFIGDSSPIEDSTPKYLREDTGSKASTHSGWTSDGNAAKLSINIVNWLAATEEYVGFDGTNHKKGSITEEPIADKEKDDPDKGEPWKQPSGGFDPWNTDTWKDGAYGAPHGKVGGSDSGNPTKIITVKEALQKSGTVKVAGYIIGTESNEYAIKIADINDKNASEYLVVKLRSEDLSTFNPKNDTSVLGKKIVVTGDRQKYYSHDGIKNVSDVKFFSEGVKIKSVASIKDIVVEVGGKLILPSVVQVTMSDDTTKNVKVTWDTSAVNTNKVGEYNLNGDVEGTDLKAKIKIIVKDKISGNMPLDIKKVNTTDMVGKEQNKFKINSTVVVNADIQNISDADVTGTVIIKIVDSENQARYIGFVKNMMLQKGNINQTALGFTMKDVEVGKYKAKVYVWDGIEHGNPLAMTGEQISEFEFEICN